MPLSVALNFHTTSQVEVVVDRKTQEIRSYIVRYLRYHRGTFGTQSRPQGKCELRAIEHQIGRFQVRLVRGYLKAIVYVCTEGVVVANQ